MENPRPEKVAVVDEVRARISEADATILTEYRGLKVQEISALRRSLRAAGGEYKVYKNTLVRFAVNDLGLHELEALLEGPTAIAFVKGDAVAVAKVLKDFGKTNPNLVVKGGLLGEKILSEAEASALADIAPREELLARLAGGMAAPMQTFAGLLAALPRSFAYAVKALIDAKGGPEAEPAAEVSTETEAEPAAEVSTETETEPAAEVSTETEPEPAAEASTETDTTPETDASAEAAPEATDAAVDPETPTETEPTTAESTTETE